MKELNWRKASYPCLGKTIDNVIVCFIDYETGYLVKGENSMQEIGHYSYRWSMEEFKPYTPPKEKTRVIDVKVQNIEEFIITMPLKKFNFYLSSKKLIKKEFNKKIAKKISKDKFTITSTKIREVE